MSSVQGGNEHTDDEKSRRMATAKMYLRFAAMILTGMVVMYWVMFAGSWEWSHVRFSESRVFMALTMGGTMGLVSVLLIAGGIALDRTQATVNDTDFMQGMIPHHSLAITRSERAQIQDLRVCELAVGISEAQRREILEMDWLINDIAENGIAATASDAADRPVPDFSRAAERECPTP